MKKILILSCIVSLFCFSAKGAAPSLFTLLENDASENAFKEAIQKGADVNEENLNGSSILVMAIEKKKSNIALLLLRCPNINKDYDDGYGTALHRAALLGDFEVVNMLIMNDVDYDQISRGTEATALHFVAAGGDKNIAEHLLGIKSFGYDQYGWGLKTSSKTIHMQLNVRDNKGKTPLHYAAQHGHQELVQLFIERGADVNALDDSNRTPLELASEKQAVYQADGSREFEDQEVKEEIHPEVIDLLLNKGATPNRTIIKNLQENNYDHTKIANLWNHEHFTSWSEERVSNLRYLCGITTIAMSCYDFYTFDATKIKHENDEYVLNNKKEEESTGSWERLKSYIHDLRSNPSRHKKLFLPLTACALFYFLKDSIPVIKKL